MAEIRSDDGGSLRQGPSAACEPWTNQGATTHPGRGWYDLQMTMQVDVANQRTVSWPGILTDQLRVNQEILAETQRRNLTTELRYEDDKHRRCHQAFKTCGYESFKDFNRPRAKGTCQWVLNHPRYVEWHSSTGD